MDKERETPKNSIEAVEALRAENKALKEEVAELAQRVEWLMEQIRLARRKQFGASSEKTDADGMEQLSLLFNEAEAYADAGQEAQESHVSAHTRRKSGNARDILPEDIDVEIVEHRMPEEELSCPQCGKAMAEIGTEVRETLKIIPAKAVLRRDVYYTYACRNCNGNDVSTPIVKTPRAPAVVPGGFATPEAIAHIAVQKFVMGSPLYRQEQEWKRAGIRLSRQTMSNWLVYAAKNWLEPIYDELHRELVKRTVLHADETVLQVLQEPGKKAESNSYMWLYRTSGDTEQPIVLYEYRPDQKKDRPKEFLEGFSGYLHTDGYQAYHSLPEGIRAVGCWAHVRRRFDEAAKAMPKDKRNLGTAAAGLAYCTRLFHEEAKLAGLKPEERREKRLEREKPVMDALFAWAKTRNAPQKSALGKALRYMEEQKPYLMAYLEDGRLELSNNRAERSISPFVISRKNFLFANTPNGAQSSAILFSLIETAKENGLDPYRYLAYVLEQAPALSADGTKNWAARLLPHCVPGNCRCLQ